MTNGGIEEFDGIRETDTPHAPGKVVPAAAMGPAGWREGFVDGFTRCSLPVAGPASTAPGRVVPHEEPSAGGGGPELPGVRVADGNLTPHPRDADAEEDEAARAAIGDVKL